MASATEILKLIVDADAKGAVTEMGRVGAAAEKDLGKTDDRLKRVGASMVSIGSSMVIGGAIAGAGLFALAKMSEDAETQQRKLTNSISNSDQVFKDNGAALRTLAQDLQYKTGADGDAIVSAQSLLVQFGLTEDQIARLSPLVTDLSLKMGVDMETAAKAVGKSVDGSSGALKKMGISVDEAKFAADPFNATMEALNGTVRGFGEQYGQTFNGQLQILKQNLSDIGESVGKGAADTLSGITGALGNVSQYLGETNPAMGETIGKLGTMGALGVVAAGGLSFTVGKFIQMRENLGPLIGKMRDAEGNITGIGRAAQAAGLAIGTLVVADVVFGIVNESAGKSKEIMDALNRTIAAGKDSASSPRELAAAFGELAYAEEDALKVSGLWETFGTDIVTTFDGAKQEVENTQAAFDKLAKTDPSGAERTLDALQQITDELPEGSGQWQANQEFIDRNRESLNLAAQANGDVATAMGESGDAAMDAASAVQEYTDALRAQFDPLFGAVDAMDKQRESQIKVMTATAELNQMQAEGKEGTAEYTAKQEELTAANYDAVRAAYSQETAMGNLASAVEDGSVSVSDARTMLQGWVSQGLITQGQADQVAFKFGIVGGKADELARRPPVLMRIGADDGDWVRKASWVNAWQPNEKQGIIGANSGQFWREANNIDNKQFPTKWVDVQARLGSGVAGLFGRAAGGPVNAGQAYVVGEKGPELFLPGKDGTIIPNHHMPSRSRTAGGDGASVNNYVTVNTVSSQGVERAVMDALASARRKGMV